jgi:hypothetical protein
MRRASCHEQQYHAVDQAGEPEGHWVNPVEDLE